MRPSLLFALGHLVIAVVGCADDRDSVKPTTLVLSPSDGDTLYTQNGAHLIAQFTDDQVINQWRLILDGKLDANGLLKDSAQRLTYVFTATQGTEFTADTLLALPEQLISGAYRFIFSAVDKRGNESVKDTVPLTVRNSIDFVSPLIDLLTISPNDTLTVGESLSISGFAIDNFHLRKLILLVGTTTSAGAKLDTFYFGEPLNGNVQYFGHTLTIDSTWQEGDYQIDVRAFDRFQYARTEVPFVVKR